MTVQVHLAFSFCILQKSSLLVVQTNSYYHYSDRLDNGPSTEPDVTEAEMFVFLSLATDGTWHKGQTEGLQGNSGSAIHTF
jgi:hypothetical protein